jgi:ubiquitin carboxyl-terminal hydrolase 25/28
MEVEVVDPSKTAKDKIIQEIVQIFSGKTKLIRKYEVDGEKKETESKSEFKTVYIDPNYKDLYSAWEETFENVVEGYKPDETHIVDAKQQTWIVELPKVLMFNIGRVTFDKEQNMYSKNNDAFEFEDVIYPDRYLIKNREEADQLRNQVNELRNKATLLQVHIDKFKNYYGKKHELSSVLHLSTHLFKSNMEGMESDPSRDGLQLFNPENLCKIADQNITENKLNEMVIYLTTLQEKTNEQVDIMEMQLTNLQNEIKESYKSVDDTPYYLHSILIHDGNHESGHFYTFIKDFAKNQYRRYTDISVSEVDVERVMLESKGGFGTINAYCLVYVSEEIYKTCKMPNLHNYAHQFKTTQNIDVYNQLVNEDIADKVYLENDNLLATIADAEASETAKVIMELYDGRIDKINKFMEDNKESLNLEYASNICQFYHKTKKNPADNSNIGKWFLLDM